MWGWIRPLLDWLTALVERRLNQPHTLSDVKTPADIRRRWTAVLRDKLRNKGGGH